MEFSESRSEVFKALSVFRNKLRQPKKDSHNKFFKSDYVTLEGVISAIDGALEGTGLSYFQEVISNSNNQISLGTTITHESGEYIQFDPLTVNVSKNDVQAFGSAETYARRYTLSAAFGIASETDDDGNQATNNIQEVVTKQEAFINGKQLAELRQEANKITTITEINPDEFLNKICELFKVNTIDQLTANSFNQAKSQLVKWKQSYTEKLNKQNEEQTQLFDDRKINNVGNEHQKNEIKWGQR